VRDNDGFFKMLFKGWITFNFHTNHLATDTLFFGQLLAFSGFITVVFVGVVLQFSGDSSFVSSEYLGNINDTCTVKAELLNSVSLVLG